MANKKWLKGASLVFAAALILAACNGRTSNIVMSLSIQNLEKLAEISAVYWQGREEVNLQKLRSLANIMADYEDLPPESRRDIFDQILFSTIYAESNLVNLYTVWKPNALDGMDSRYIGRVGASPTGQYAAAYTRESGQILSRTTNDLEGTMTYLNGLNARTGKERVEHPTARVINGKDTFAIRMMVPIINPYTNEVVGGVGCLISIDGIQSALEYTILNNDEVALMTIYSSNGFILAHFIPDRVGRRLLDVDLEYADQIQAVNQAVLAGMYYQGGVYDSVLDTDIEFVMVPLQIGSSDTTWTIMIGTTKEYIMRDLRRLIIF